MKESKKKFFYIISNPAWEGYYKIGITANPSNRISNYNTGDPHRAYKFERLIEPFDVSAKEIEVNMLDRYDWAKNEWIRAYLGDIEERLDDICKIKMEVLYVQAPHGSSKGHNRGAGVPRNEKKIAISSVVYPSISEASRLTGKSLGYIHKRLNEESDKEYVYL